jgi:PTS system fructose-specific IIC component
MPGSAGAQNILTEQEVREADVVIIATDIHVNMYRFADKPVCRGDVTWMHIALSRHGRMIDGARSRKRLPSGMVYSGDRLRERL